MVSVKLLSSDTVHRIASSQVITSVSSAVKELVENALDAGATNIEVKLEDYGLGKIEVRDNGCGIMPTDAPFMAQRHYTSKISTFDNLEGLMTYGFRGEALCSLCGLSNVSIMTKTEKDEVAICYTLDQTGKVLATKPLPSTCGTTVTASMLFKNLPVRKQISSNQKKCKDELKKVEELVMSFGLIHPNLRIVLRHNKSTVWQKNKVSDYRMALLTVFGSRVVSQMDRLEFKDESTGLEVIGYLPKPGSDPSITSRATNDRCFIYINKRPVVIREVSQVARELYLKHTDAGNRHPIAFISIEVPPSGVDVNLEPNKTRVLLLDKDIILNYISGLFEEFYFNKAETQGNVEADSSVTTKNDSNLRRENSASSHTRSCVSGSTEKNSSLNYGKENEGEKSIVTCISNFQGLQGQGHLNDCSTDVERIKTIDSNECSFVKESRLSLNFKDSNTSMVLGEINSSSAQLGNNMDYSTFKEGLPGRKCNYRNVEGTDSAAPLLSTRMSSSDHFSIIGLTDCVTGKSSASRSKVDGNIDNSTRQIDLINADAKMDSQDMDNVAKLLEHSPKDSVTSRIDIGCFQSIRQTTGSVIGCSNSVTGNSSASGFKEDCNKPSSRLSDTFDDDIDNSTRQIDVIYSGAHELVSQDMDVAQLLESSLKDTSITSRLDIMCFQSMTQKTVSVIGHTNSVPGKTSASGSKEHINRQSDVVEDIETSNRHIDFINDDAQMDSQDMDNVAKLFERFPTDTNVTSQIGIGCFQSMTQTKASVNEHTSSVHVTGETSASGSKEDKNNPSNNQSDVENTDNSTRQIDLINAGAELDSQDVDNVAKMLDWSPKDTSVTNEIDIGCFQSMTQAPVTLAIENQVESSKDDSMHTPNFNVLHCDNLFDDDAEFDQMLVDAVKKGSSTQASSITKQTPPLSTVVPMTVQGDSTKDGNGLSDKDWSKGKVFSDRQGSALEPTTLITPAILQHKEHSRTSVTPGKRKHSYDKENSRLITSSKKIRRVPEITNQPLITVHSSPGPQQRSQLAKTVNIQFSIELLKLHYKERSRKRHSDSSSASHLDQDHLIGRLDPWGVWLMRQGSTVTYVNQYRIQEQVLYHKLLSNHSLPTDTLDRPIVLNNKMVGGEECWKVLTELECQCNAPDPIRYLTDDRIKANGFDVRQKIDPDSGDAKVEVYGITTSLPFYGIPDLAELIGLIKNSGSDNCSLTDCRPLKVVNYLKGEAVRVSRGLNSRMSREDIESTLKQMREHLPKDVTKCLHEQPFFGLVAKLPILE